jgi:phosphoribosylformylglycinamidine synthase
MIHRIEIAVRRGLRDARGEHAASQIRDFLHLPVGAVRTRDVYQIEADLTPEEVDRIVAELTDPVLQVGAADRLDDGPFDVAVSVGFKPGVADPVGKSALVAIEDTLGRRLGPDAAVYTSVLYLLDGLDCDQAERVAGGLLANAVIQEIRLEPYDAWRASPPDLRVPKMAGGPAPEVVTLDLTGGDAELERISREGLLALSLEEMRAIRDHFAGLAESPQRLAAGLGPAPTDVELECLAQTWSEHCKHKIFAATIDYHEGPGEPERIESLFKTYIQRVTHEIDADLRATTGGSWLV